MRVANIIILVSHIVNSFLTNLVVTTLVILISFRGAHSSQFILTRWQRSRHQVTVLGLVNFLPLNMGAQDSDLFVAIHFRTVVTLAGGLDSSLLDPVVLLLLLALPRHLGVLVLIAPLIRLLNVVLGGVHQRFVHESLVEQDLLNVHSRQLRIIVKLLLLDVNQVRNHKDYTAQQQDKHIKAVRNLHWPIRWFCM